MPKKPARERAARALCRHDGHPPDIQFEGVPMWRSYLDEVDIVLQEVVSPEEFVRLIHEGHDRRDRERPDRT